MSKFKKFVLSVLLFAFTFFVVHDYVINFVDTDTQCELYQFQNDKASLDLPSKIHSHIHLVLDVPQSSTLNLLCKISNEKPLHVEYELTSYINFVKFRPPLV